MRKVKLLLAKLIVKSVQQLHAVYDRINLYKLRGELKQLGSGAIIEGPSNIMNPQCISIGDDFTARSHVAIRAFTGWDDMAFTPELIIGNNVHLATGCVINCTHRIEIRDHASIGVGTRIMDHAHGLSDYSDIDILVMKRTLTSKGGVIIGTNVMLGTGVVVLPGVEIGANSIIGSNSVVTRSIPPNCIAAGIPARVLKTIEKKGSGLPS